MTHDDKKATAKTVLLVALAVALGAGFFFSLSQMNDTPPQPAPAGVIDGSQ